MNNAFTLFLMSAGTAGVGLMAAAPSVVASNTDPALSAVYVGATDSISTAATAVGDSIPTYELLDDFEVVAMRQIVKSDGATTTYSIDDDPAAEGRTVLDVLRNVPGVTVDGQDNILVNGQSSFSIKVDGRDDPALANNASTVLKSMPASSYARIEVITDPGAKYDAEGGAGILNFVTGKARRNDGYNGNISASASNSHYSADGVVTARIDKVTFSVHANYGGNNGLERYNSNMSTINYLESGNSETQFLRQKYNYNFCSAGYKFSWEPTAKDLFTTSFTYFDNDFSIDDARMTTKMYDAGKNLLWNTRKTINGSMLSSSYNGDASYQHNFDDKGHLLVASYAFAYGKDRTRIDEDMVYQSEALNPLFYSNLNSTWNRTHTAQIDYTNPFGGEHHKLEAGVKGVFRRNTASGSASQAADADSPVCGVPGSESDIAQMMDILAAYGSYTFISEKWSARAGLRYEHTRMGIDTRTGTGGSFRTNLDNAVPNLSVSYLFSPARTLRLAYAMRISRPSISQVNPFRMEYASTIRCGNPDLNAERINNISLSYSSFGTVLGGSISASYSHTANSIDNITSLEGEKTLETYANIGSRQSASLNGYLNWNVITGMSLSVNASINWVDYNSPSFGTHSTGWTGNIGGNWSYTVPNVATFGAFGGWMSGQKYFQSESAAMSWEGISVSRYFLKDDRLRLTLSAYNFAEPKRKYKYTTSSEALRSSSVSTQYSWNVGLSVTWNFGNLKATVKDTAADLDFNDSSSGGSGKSTGGGL